MILIQCAARAAEIVDCHSREIAESNCEENVSEKLFSDQEREKREDLRFGESDEKSFQVFKISFSW